METSGAGRARRRLSAAAAGCALVAFGLWVAVLGTRAACPGGQVRPVDLDVYATLFAAVLAALGGSLWLSTRWDVPARRPGPQVSLVVVLVFALGMAGMGVQALATSGHGALDSCLATVLGP